MPLRSLCVLADSELTDRDGVQVPKLQSGGVGNSRASADDMMGHVYEAVLVALLVVR